MERCKAVASCFRPQASQRFSRFLCESLQSLVCQIKGLTLTELADTYRSDLLCYAR